MLHSILKAKGRQLAKKSKQRLYWWSYRRWHSVISIIPELTKDMPLWNRDETSLASIRLFNLTPEQLQVKLQHYWSKPRWRQWLQGWFTSINQHLEAWSYYQQCLVFREIQREEPEINFNSSVTVPMTTSECIMEKLTDWLSQNELQFEARLNKNSAYWLTRNFELALSHYETQRQKEFFEKLENELKKLARAEAIEIKKELQAAYRKTSKILRDYLSTWYRYTYLGASQAPKRVTERSVVPVAGPSTSSGSVKQRKKGVDMTFFREEESVISSHDPDPWFNARRKQIRAILEKKEPDGVQQISEVLEESFNKLISFIDTQLGCYGEIKNKFLVGKSDCEAAVKATIDLQSLLSNLYKKGSLLFHPDKTILEEWGNELTPCFNTLFSRYKQYLLDENLENLSERATQLKERLSQLFKNTDVDERLESLLESATESLNELIAECCEDRKKMQENLRDQEEKIKELNEKINQVSQSMEHIKPCLVFKQSNAISEEKNIQEENETEERNVYSKP